MTNQNRPTTDYERVRVDIERQAQLIQDSISGLRSEAIRVASELGEMPARIYLVGCGDSLNVGMATRFTWERLLGVPVEAIPAMTFSRYAVDEAPEGALVVALSQSGTVSRVVEAVRVAQERNLKTLAITGKRNSPLALEPTNAKYIFDFPKLGFVPGTTSYAIGLVIFYELAAALCSSNSQAQSLRGKIDRLPAIVEETVDISRITAQRHASQIRKEDSILVLGSGPQLATAHFTARKFFEMSQRIVFSQETEEYAHDEYSIVNSNFVGILYAPPDRGFGRSKEIALYLGRVARHLALVTDRSRASEFVSIADLLYDVPDAPIETSPITYAIPAQWLGYYCAKQFGGSYYAFDDPVHERDGDAQIYTSEIVSL